MRGSGCLVGKARGLGVVALGLFVLASMAAHAVPVFGKVHPLRQPDGSLVQVRIWGDEYYQLVESLDGYTLVRDPQTQEICYAKSTVDGLDLESTGLRVGAKGLTTLGIAPHLRPAQKVVTERVEEARALAAGGLKTARGAMAAPTTGAVSGICIIVDFSDDAGTIPRTEVDNYCNQVGYTGFGNNGSVRDYYSAVSGGQLTYTNYVHHFGATGYYRALHPKTYYDDPNQPYGTRAVELITEALNAMNASVNFSNYDQDGDGYVDAVNCFYAGTTTSGWATGLWPHQGSMDLLRDGVRIGAYQISDMGSSLTLGTFCHENGHLVMNWPDLYDYDYDSNGVGNFCLMAYSPTDYNPVQPCAPLKIQAGWGTVVNLSTPQTGLSSTAGVNTFHRYENPDNSAESYVIENRQATGRDAGLPDSGLAIWHVDTDGSNNWNEQLPFHHFLVTLVQADGLWHLEHNTNYGDANDLWSSPSPTHFGPATTPNSNWWSGMPSNLDLSNVSGTAATMTFDFTLPNPTIEPVAEFGATGPVGGAFSPSSNTYTLTNAGAAALSWTAVPGQSWLTVSPSGGTLAPGASTSVLASFNASAAALVSGLYGTTITFTNVSGGESWTRSVSLRVGDVSDCTEWFQAADNDLDLKTITFTPNADGTTYWACRTAAPVFPSGTAGSTAATLTDDDSVNVALTGGQQVYLYGQAYSSIYIGSNGYITFGGQDSTPETSTDNHFSLPRVSGLFDDLDPSAGGTVSYKQLSDRMVVTYNGVPLYGTFLANSFQIELFFDKTIRITWLNIADSFGLAGLSAGAGTPLGYVESDFGGYSICAAPSIATLMSSSAPDPTAVSPIPVTVSFGEPVTGFASGDITTTNGAVSNFSGSGASYSFSLTPSGQGTVTATVAAGVAAGSGGRTNLASTISRVYDSAPPAITIGAPTPTLTAQGPVTYTVTYTGASAITLDNAHVTLVASGATGTANVSGTGSTRTVTVSNISGSGTIALSILAGTATDAVGNAALAAGPSAPFTVDNTVMSLSIGPPSAAATKSGPITYTVRYDNVASVSLVAGKIALNRTGTANATLSVSPAKTTVNRLVTLSNITGEGTLGISIAADTARDAFNAPAPAVGPSATFVVDAVSPVITLLGGTLVPIEVNTSFTDPGATAYDAIDGDLTGSIVADTSGIDAATIGHYAVSYSVQDAAGNVATRTRTVSVTPLGEATLPLAAWPAAVALACAAHIVLRRRKKT